MNSIFVKYRQYFIVNQAGIVIEASESFCNLTEYSTEELIGNSVEILFKNKLLIEFNFSGDDYGADTFLFTKSMQARQVRIEKSRHSKSNHLLFQIYEIPNSRFEDKNIAIEQLISENVIGAGVYTSNLMLIRANQIYLDYLPEPFRTKETAYGKLLYELIPGFAGSSLEKNWKDVIKNRKSLYIQERQGILLGAGIKYWDTTITPVIVNDEVKYLVSILQDVTERVVNRAVISEQKEKYETLLDNMSDGLIAFDPEGNYAHTNQTIQDLRTKYGIKRFEDVIYYDVNGMEIPKEDLPRYRMLRGEEVKGQRFMIKRDGRDCYFECSSSLIRNREGKIEMSILNLRDVTHTIENENKIRRQKEEMDALLNNMIEGLVIGDTQGTILNMNTNALSMLGLSSLGEMPTIEKFYQKYDLVDLDGNFLAMDRWPLARAMSKERFTHLELWIHFKNRDRKPFLCNFTGTPVYNDRGELIFAMITFKDITKLKMMQENLISTIKEKNDMLSEALAFKDEFLYLITHEMKTPLAIISSALQTMNVVCGNLPDKAEKYLKTIRQNTNRQLRLVNTLLEIIRINSGKIKLNKELFDIVSLAELIVKSIRPIANQKNVRVNFCSEIIRKNIYIDEEKVERILLNLLSNALKFTPKDKEIQVKIFTKKVRHKSMVCISIHDEGIGIPKDKQSIIFERFGQVNTVQSRPSEGTGIGLYLVKLLVDAMGGCITLESEEGTGSNFTVMLPEAKPEKDTPSVNRQPDRSSDDSRLTDELAIQFSDIYL